MNVMNTKNVQLCSKRISGYKYQLEKEISPLYWTNDNRNIARALFTKKKKIDCGILLIYLRLTLNVC